MTSNRLLARNTALNLAAQIAPLFIAVVAVPKLIDGLGADRFGVLTLAWALIGYFGLFDFGIGRALTQTASEALGRGDMQRLEEVSSVAINVMFALGILGGLLLAVLTPWLAYDFLKMDNALRPDAAHAFYLLAASLPFVLGTLAFRGLFEAHQHFGLATALRLPFALFNFVGPLLVLPFSNSLVSVVAVLVGGRVVTWIAHAYFGLRRYPWLRMTSMGQPASIVPLLRLGGWMTVSNVVSPLMVNLDRFLIAALLSVTAVAYYATPYELVTKLLFVPGAVIGVFFPAFAAAYVQDRARTVVMIDRAARLILIAVFPAVVVLVAFAHEGLAWWIGRPDFARESASVLQVLAAGVFVSSMGQVPFALLQATGRPDITAKLHVLELPIYAVLILALSSRLGLIGVALAWTLRNAIDTAVLCWLSRAQLAEATPALFRSLKWAAALSASLVVLALQTSTLARAVATALVLAAFAVIAWRWILQPPERHVATGLWREKLKTLREPA